MKHGEHKEGTEVHRDLKTLFSLRIDKSAEQLSSNNEIMSYSFVRLISELVSLSHIRLFRCAAPLIVSIYIHSTKIEQLCC